MRVPAWARWALVAVLVLGIAAGGVAANLAVLDSTDDDTRLGTLSAKSLAVAGGQAPPAPAVTGDDDPDGDRGSAPGAPRAPDRDDDSGGDDDDSGGDDDDSGGESDDD